MTQTPQLFLPIGLPPNWKEIKKQINALPHGAKLFISTNLGVSQSAFSKMMVSKKEPTYDKVLQILSILNNWNPSN